jgi:hydroxysqualene dehydroxylase
VGRVVVVGAGLAGLVAAEALSALGREVLVLEASAKAGGRCRSYFDRTLGRRIDNGNHLILSANRHVLEWARRIGGAGSLLMCDAEFPFLDLSDGSRFAVRIGRGPVGALVQSARSLGVPLPTAIRQMARLATSRRGVSVAAVLPDRDRLWRAFWDPMTRAILNEAPASADAGLLRATLLRSFAHGARTCRPVMATGGLGPALIDPALTLLARRGVEVRFRTPVRAIALNGARATALRTGRSDIALGQQDMLILAIPPQATVTLLPDLVLPREGRPIVNAHFVVPESGLPPILGMLGGSAQWLFRRGDVVSATVSAADSSPLAGVGRDEALARLWGEVSVAVRAHAGACPDGVPTSRLLRERAATFDQTPQGAARRRPTATRWCNVLLAGDHVATGLPATLEGAVISGEWAARAAAPDTGAGSVP